MNDYKERSYLSTTEVAAYLGIKVREIQSMIKQEKLPAVQSTSGQYRIRIEDVKAIEQKYKTTAEKIKANILEININNTSQKVFFENSQNMKELSDNTVHLAVTSPPYFNAKMYSGKALKNDLGNIHDMEKWFSEIGKVWKEVFRVLQPGRKFFLNIMNLPVRYNNTFRTLNLVGKSVDLCENAGFIFKRDIIWHKTNGVRAHFGTYPYPGGILINNMHESILEFEKPNDKKFNKYAHLTKEIKEKSKIGKDFWLSIKNSDVWLMSPEKSGDGREHIAPFPYELPYRFIKAYTYIGETILDPFCGSGTSLLAAKELGRNGIGYEINSGFAKTIKSRIKKCLSSPQ
ncbi:MAG: helix-turn-helix domain-containing protein [Candidatus Fibromonas sp.]|jgi:excisionase family DNA binding protein|nr:helix-turn-helix domain-containing protein [Candidatus Fibromonas sp.]